MDRTKYWVRLTLWLININDTKRKKGTNGQTNRQSHFLSYSSQLNIDYAVWPEGHGSRSVLISATRSTFLSSSSTRGQSSIVWAQDLLSSQQNQLAKGQQPEGQGSSSPATRGCPRCRWWPLPSSGRNPVILLRWLGMAMDVPMIIRLRKTRNKVLTAILVEVIKAYYEYGLRMCCLSSKCMR